MYGQMIKNKDPEDSSRLFHQVRDLLRNQIQTGQIPVGETIPTELELQRTFKVSRSTVRSAIRELADDGLLRAKPGVGTVVIRSRPQVNSSHLRGITEDLRRQGVSTRANVLRAEIVMPTPAIRSRLELPNGERVLQLVRLRTIGGTPLALINSYVPESVGIGPDEDFSGPLYELIERSHALYITYGRDVISARGARTDEARALEVEAGAPILQVRRTAFIDPDRPIEYVEAAIRSDLYEYHVTLPRGKE
jgi:GntR family transcriptional regulator